MALVNIAFPDFTPPPTTENAGIKPVKTVQHLDLKKASAQLKELLPKTSD